MHPTKVAPAQRRATLILALLLSACAGGSTLPGGAPAGSPGFSRAPVKHRLTRMTLRITIPHASRASSARRAHYVSPATQSLVFAVSFGGSPVSGGGGYANVTPGSTYCSGSNASQPLICDVTLPIEIAQTGSYAIALATFDQTQSGSTSSAPCTPPATTGCAGNLLSQSVVTQTLTAGTDNTVSVVLGGVPASLTVAPVTPGYLQGNASGLLLWGKGAQQIAIETRDADGNTIVGPGSPSIAVSSSNTANLTVTSPSSSSPNIATLQATTSGSPAAVTPGLYSLTVTATPTSASGASTLTASVPVLIAHSIVYIANRTSPFAIDVFYDGNTSVPNYTIASGLEAQQLAVDANGTLYSANESGTVTAYPQGATAASTTIALPNTPTTSAASGVAVDGNGTLYVSDSPNGAIYQYPAGSSSGTTLVSGVALPVNSVLDTAGTLYVVLGSGAGVSLYSGGTNTGTIADSRAQGVAIDAAGNLYVSNNTQQNVAIYAPGSTTAETTISSGLTIPVGLAVDAAGALYVADFSLRKVEIYAPPLTDASAPSESIALPGNVTVYAVAVVPAALSPSQIQSSLARAHARPTLSRSPRRT